MDNEIEEIIERLKLKHPTGACGTHPNDRCFSSRCTHWVLVRPKLVLWAAHILSPPSIPTWTHLTVPLLQMGSRAMPFAPHSVSPVFVNGKAKDKAAHTPAPTRSKSSTYQPTRPPFPA